MKKCEVCGVKAYRLFRYKTLLCTRHYAQMDQYGRIFKRTSKDKNEIFNRGGYYEVALYNRKLEIIAFAQFSKKDLKLVQSYKWSLERPGNYATTYKYIRGKHKPLKLHRLILGNPKDFEIDHINGNRLDNQRENLRTVNRSQNLWNMQLPKRNTSGFKGVFKQPSGNTWFARITLNYKRIYLGNFPTPALAAAAYNHAAKKYFGEYACLNIIP